MQSIEDPNQFTVKEILTQFVLPGLEDLRKAATLQQEHNEKRFAQLEAAKNRAYGGLLLLTAIVVPLSIPVIGAIK